MGNLLHLASGAGEPSEGVASYPMMIQDAGGRGFDAVIEAW
jgi:hypothetical protein